MLSNFVLGVCGCAGDWKMDAFVEHTIKEIREDVYKRQDKDRGAALGWEKLRARLDEYMTWMNESAPSLRNLTGSELAGAVQRLSLIHI